MPNFYIELADGTIHTFTHGGDVYMKLGGQSENGVLTTVVADVNVRADKGVRFADVGDLNVGDTVYVTTPAVPAEPADGYTWRQITQGEYAGKWVASKASSGKIFLGIETAVEPPPPPPPPTGTVTPSALTVRNGRLVERATDAKISPIGANLERLFAFPEFNPHAGNLAEYWGNPNPAVGDKTLGKAALTFGKTVIRYFGAFDYGGRGGNATNVPDLVAKNVRMLDKLGERGLYGMITLNDSIWLGGQAYATLFEERKWHTDGGMGHLNAAYWREEGWRVIMLPFTKALVAATKNHPALAGYTLFNEPAFYTDRDDPALLAKFKLCVNTLAAAIREQSNAPIAIGTISRHHITDNETSAKFYGDMPHINIVDGHHYQEEGKGPDAAFREEGWSLPDAAWARTQPNVAYIASEWGHHIHTNQSVEAAMRYLDRQFVGNSAGHAWIYPWFFGTQDQNLGNNEVGAASVIQYNGAQVPNPTFFGEQGIVHQLWLALQGNRWS